MPMIYHIGSNGYWTGEAREIGPKDGVPRGWTRKPVPALGAGEFAVWAGSGWKVIHTAYTPPVILQWPDLPAAQVALSQWIDNLTYQIEGKYPQIIRASWPEEEAMALAYKLGTETEAQLAELTVLAGKKDRTVDEHADRVLWLAGTFREIKGHVHALWLETDAALEAAEPAQYEDIFNQAKQKAAPLAEAYGLDT